MPRCANSEVLDRYLSGEEQFEKICDRFEGDVSSLIRELRSMTRDYEGYDMTDLLKVILGDIVLEELGSKVWQ